MHSSGGLKMTPLPFKHAEEPMLFFVPLLDREFDQAENDALLALEVYH
jgi:hypothetical protein